MDALIEETNQQETQAEVEEVVKEDPEDLANLNQIQNRYHLSMNTFYFKWGSHLFSLVCSDTLSGIAMTVERVAPTTPTTISPSRE